MALEVERPLTQLTLYRWDPGFPSAMKEGKSSEPPEDDVLPDPSHSSLIEYLGKWLSTATLISFSSTCPLYTPLSVSLVSYQPALFPPSVAESDEEDLALGRDAARPEDEEFRCSIDALRSVCGPVLSPKPQIS